MYIHMYMYIYICTDVHICNIYIYIYIHTYTLAVPKEIKKLDTWKWMETHHLWGYPLVVTKSSLWKVAIEIVDLPMKK